MLNIFTCVEQKFIYFINKRPVEEFPIKAYFLREMVEFDHSLKDMDRLGGTLGHVETENAFLFASNKIPQKKGLTPAQQSSLRLFKMVI